MKRHNLISPRQQRKDIELIETFLKGLIIDFMYVVNKKVTPEEEEQHQINVNLKYVECNAKWKHKCHDKDYGYMKLNLHSFSKNIQTLASGSQIKEAEVAGVETKGENKGKVIRHKFATQAEADAFVKRINDKNKPGGKIISL